MPVPIAVHQLYAKPCDQVQVSSRQQAGDEGFETIFSRDVTPECIGLPLPKAPPGEAGLSTNGELAVTSKVFFSPRGFVSWQPDVPAEMVEAPFPKFLQHEIEMPTDITPALANNVLCSPKYLVSMKPVEPAEIPEAPFPDDLSDATEFPNNEELASTANVLTGPRAPATMQPDLRAEEEEEEEDSARYRLQGARFDAAADSRPPGSNEARESANVPVEAPDSADVQHGSQVRSATDAEQGQGRVESPATAADLSMSVRARRDLELCLPDCAIMMIVFSTAGLVVMIVSMAIEELVHLDQL